MKHDLSDRTSTDERHDLNEMNEKHELCKGISTNKERDLTGPNVTDKKPDLHETLQIKRHEALLIKGLI